MNVKDKLVSLEDIKTVYDDLATKGETWIDITNSLTWSRPTFFMQKYYYTPSINLPSSVPWSNDVTCATLASQPGTIYRVTGFGYPKQLVLTYNNGADSGYYHTIPLIFKPDSDTYFKYDFIYHEDNNWEYNQIDVYMPYNGTLYFYDYTKQVNSSLSSMVKVEKYLRYVI